MGKDHIWDSTQWDRETRPKDHRIQHSWDREPDPKTIYGQRPYMGFNTVGQGTRLKDHIWAKTIYGIETRPKDHIWDSTQWDRETGPKDHRIQHSWDRETRPKDHIWAKTIYGIEIGPKDQHSGTGKPDPKTIGFNTVGTGKPDPKTIYGQRPYMGLKLDPKTMGFNTVGQGNQTQRPYMGLKPTIYGIQNSWDRETRGETGSKDHIWD